MSTPRRNAGIPPALPNAGASPASRLTRILPALILAALIPGCFQPDYQAIANRLREQTITQDRQISDLQEQLTNRDATIASLRGQLAGSAPRLQTLPDDRLAQLFTASRLEIQSSTDSWDFGDGKGLSGFRIFLRTLTDDGTVITATGTLTIEAFELPPAPEPPKRIGAWTFTPQQMKQSWYSGLGLNHYAFSCPWSAPGAITPTRADITFKARFIDALTGLTLVAELNKRIALPAPASRPK